MAAKELPLHFSTKQLTDPDNPLGQQLRNTAENLYEPEVTRNLNQER